MVYAITLWFFYFWEIQDIFKTFQLYAEAETSAKTTAYCSAPSMINKGTKEAADRMQERYCRSRVAQFHVSSRFFSLIFGL